MRAPLIRTAALLAAGLTAACAAGTRTAADPPVAGQTADGPPPVEREFRGVWLATVANLDWPSRPGLPVDSQKAELVRMFDRAAELRLNAVIMQVRPAGDALYASALEPWSEYLTGTEGRAPEPFYDPLEFAIELARARALELHAWFNPYRARHPSARSAPAANHISVAHPELVRRYGSYLWMDPGSDDVRRRSIDVMLDVVRRYDVDGIHLDDYFYPYREVGPDGRELDFPDSATYALYRARGGTLGRSDWRRANVDRFVAELYDGVKRTKPWVKVGISPIGTWRPNVLPQLGGFDAYEQIYADARKWLVDGSLDYFVPQLYWPIARTDVSFPVLLDWWARQNPRGRGLYAGMNTGNVNLAAPDPLNRAGWRPEEVIGQIYVARGHPGADGHVHFRIGSLMPDGALRAGAAEDTLPDARREALRAQRQQVQARRDSLTLRLRNETYARPALTPAMRWLDDRPPPAPRVTLRADASLIIEPTAGEPALLWVVQARHADGWRTHILPGSTREWRVPRAAASDTPAQQVWVSAVDRAGNLSAPVRAQ